MTRWRRLTMAAQLLALSATLALGAGDPEPDDDVEGGTIGTGIMGEITGLGSIHVGGTRIVVPEGAEVLSRLGARPSDDLSVGETVVVEALRQGGVLVAESLRSYYPLVGPVEEISGAALRVLGLTLDISEAQVPELAEGDWVAVSGLWRGGTVAVSHLRRVTPQDHVIVNGTFTVTEADGQQVGPFPLAGPALEHAETGAHLRVSGTWDAAAGRLAPDRIDSGLFSPGLRSLRVEGYLSQPDPTGTYFIYGSGITFVTDTQDMRVPEDRSIFCVSPGAQARFTELMTLDLPRAERLRLLERRVADAEAPEC